MNKNGKKSLKKATSKPVAKATKKPVKRTAKKVVTVAAKKVKKAISKRVKTAKPPVKKDGKKASVTERLDHLLEVGVNPFMKMAGFRKTARVYRRNLSDLIQVVQIHHRTIVSGGSSAPKGHFMVWAGCAVREQCKKTNLYEYDCHFHFELIASKIPQVILIEEVPPTRGKQRQTVEKDILSNFQLLVDILDTLKTKSDILAFAQKIGRPYLDRPFDMVIT